MLKKLLSRLISIEIGLGNITNELDNPTFNLEIFPNDPNESCELGWFQYCSFSNEATECFR